VVDFAIMTFSIFPMMKLIKKLKRQSAAAPGPPAQEKLPAKIRDPLKAPLLTQVSRSNRRIGLPFRKGHHALHPPADPARKWHC
jgi:hypothetical protein